MERGKKDCIPKDPRFPSKDKEGWDCAAFFLPRTLGNVWVVTADADEQRELQKQDDKALKKEIKKCKGSKALECVGEIREKIDAKREEAIRQINPEFAQCKKDYTGDVTKDRSTVWVCETPLKL